MNETELNLRQKVKQRLVVEIGHRVFPGQPEFDQTYREWRVPLLCMPVRGRVSYSLVEEAHSPVEVGQAILDEQLRFLRFPTQKEVQAVLDLVSQLQTASSRVAQPSPRDNRDRRVKISVVNEQSKKRA